MKLTDIVQSNFKDYAAEVIQRRALINVCDGLKPSARQIFYALHTDKITHKKPAISTIKLIGSGMRFYTHGDASLEGIIMRAGQPFSHRYPLIDVAGSFGDLTESGNWASPRYTKARLSEIASYMFNSIDKNTISKWYDNYDDTEQYPAVLPCLGFWPLIEGSMGIGVALASSIPAFNLREMNTALIECLYDRPFELPMPDFPTGATLINPEQVRESLEKGTGYAAKMRAVIEYNSKKHQLIVTEIPPLTYTGKIVDELAEMIKDPSCGFDRFLDITGEKPKIIIELTKSASPDQVISRLYKETSLQNTYSINMTMLDGSSPKVFGLREAMRRHLEHEEICYRRAFEYDLQQLKDRLHIVDGYIIACANIEEVIQVIKGSKSSNDARQNLMIKFDLSILQAAAVLKLTLSRIASLEVEKFNTEKSELLLEIEKIKTILSDVNALKKVIEKGLRDVMVKFSDARRTKIMEITDEDDTRVLYFTKTGKVYLNKPKNEVVLCTILSGTPYIGITRKGIVFRGSDNIKSSKKIFNIGPDNELIGVYTATDLDFLVIYSQDKKFRCLEVGGLNKTKTTLSLTNLTDAYISPERISKNQYRKN